MRPSLDQLREGLSRALHEPDTTRVLDSLEMLVALSYLTGCGVMDTVAPPTTRPATIDGWLHWLDQQAAGELVDAEKAV